MATTIQQKLYGTIFSVLTTELNSLGSATMSGAGPAQGSDATTAQDLFGDIEIVATWGTNPVAGTVVEIYFAPSADGTNYADAPTSTTGKELLVATVAPRAVTTAQRFVYRDVPLPPGLFKVYCFNGPTAMAASGNTVKIRPHSLQSV